MTEPTAYQKLAANLAYLRKNGASVERQKQEIAKFKQSQDAVTKAERALTGLEKVGAFGSKLGSGATFGLLDEAVGLFDEDAKNEQRFLQKQFAEENPGVAFGAEILGSLAMPGTILKQAPRAAGVGRKIATTLGEGALQGGASGFGNAEGNVLDRAGETLRGVAVGSVAAGAIGGATKLASKTVGNVLDRLGIRGARAGQSVERMADNLPEEDIVKARGRLSELTGRNLGDEAMVADVLPQGEGALRQVATSNRAVRSTVDKELKGRSTRLANRADERLLDYAGTTGESTEKTLAGMRKSAQDKARPLYEAAQQEADAAPRVERLTASAREELAAMGAKVPEGDAVDAAMALPFVQRNLARVKSAQAFKELPDDSHQVLDQIYKEIGEDIRLLQEKRLAKNMTTAERRELADLIEQRGVLLDGIKSRAPSYEPALGAYAGDAAAARAFERGSRVRDVPADMVPDELASLDAANVPFYKRGAAEGFRSDVPANELGDLARFQSVLKNLGTKEQVQRFRQLYGDDKLKAYLGELLEMARMQGMKAGAGESTTVDKMLEQMQADPDAIAGLVAQIVRGNPTGAIAQIASPTNMVSRALERLRASKSAEEQAGFLTQRGDAKVRAALDLLERLRKEGRLPRRRDFSRVNPGAAAARTAGSYAGRP